MICTFFGHRDAPDSISSALKEKIIEMITTIGIKDFYVGNNGNFDFLVQKLLKEISRSYPCISFSIVLSRPYEQAISGIQDKTIFPEGLEFSIPRFAISKRNEWLITHSTHLIAYLTNNCTNCFKWVNKAKSKGLDVVKLEI